MSIHPYTRKLFDEQDTYTLFEGTAVELASFLRKQKGLWPISAHQVAKEQLEAENLSERVRWSQSCPTADWILYHPSGDIKVVRSSYGHEESEQVLWEYLASRPDMICKSGTIRLGETQEESLSNYDDIKGQVITKREWKDGNYEAGYSPVWRSLSAPRSHFLNEYYNNMRFRNYMELMENWDEQLKDIYKRRPIRVSDCKPEDLPDRLGQVGRKKNFKRGDYVRVYSQRDIGLLTSQIQSLQEALSCAEGTIRHMRDKHKSILVHAKRATHVENHRSYMTFMGIEPHVTAEFGQFAHASLCRLEDGRGNIWGQELDSRGLFLLETI